MRKKDKKDPHELDFSVDTLTGASVDAFPYPTDSDTSSDRDETGYESDQSGPIFLKKEAPSAIATQWQDFCEHQVLPLFSRIEQWGNDLKTKGEDEAFALLSSAFESPEIQQAVEKQEDVLTTQWLFIACCQGLISVSQERVLREVARPLISRVMDCLHQWVRQGLSAALAHAAERDDRRLSHGFHSLLFALFAEGSGDLEEQRGHFIEMLGHTTGIPASLYVAILEGLTARIKHALSADTNDVHGLSAVISYTNRLLTLSSVNAQGIEATTRSILHALIPLFRSLYAGADRQRLPPSVASRWRHFQQRLIEWHDFIALPHLPQDIRYRLIAYDWPRWDTSLGWAERANGHATLLTPHYLLPPIESVVKTLDRESSALAAHRADLKRSGKWEEVAQIERVQAAFDRTRHRLEMTAPPAVTPKWRREVSDQLRALHETVKEYLVTALQNTFNTWKANCRNDLARLSPRFTTQQVAQQKTFRYTMQQQFNDRMDRMKAVTRDLQAILDQTRLAWETSSDQMRSLHTTLFHVLTCKLQAARAAMSGDLVIESDGAIKLLKAGINLLGIATTVKSGGVPSHKILSIVSKGLMMGVRIMLTLVPEIQKATKNRDVMPSISLTQKKGPSDWIRDRYEKKTGDPFRKTRLTNLAQSFPKAHQQERQYRLINHIINSYAGPLHHVTPASQEVVGYYLLGLVLAYLEYGLLSKEGRHSDTRFVNELLNWLALADYRLLTAGLGQLPSITVALHSGTSVEVTTLLAHVGRLCTDRQGRVFRFHYAAQRPEQFGWCWAVPSEVNRLNTYLKQFYRSGSPPPQPTEEEKSADETVTDDLPILYYDDDLSRFGDGGVFEPIQSVEQETMEKTVGTLQTQVHSLDQTQQAVVEARGGDPKKPRSEEMVRLAKEDQNRLEQLEGENKTLKKQNRKLKKRVGKLGKTVTQTQGMLKKVEGVCRSLLDEIVVSQREQRLINVEPMQQQLAELESDGEEKRSDSEEQTVSNTTTMTAPNPELSANQSQFNAPQESASSQQNASSLSKTGVGLFSHSASSEKEKPSTESEDEFEESWSEDAPEEEELPPSLSI